MARSHPELRQAIIDGAKLILNTGAISMSNHGNFSVKVPDKDQILITAQSSLAGVTPESLAIRSEEHTSELQSH